MSVPDELKAKFINFPPTFNNIDVERKYIGDLKTYAEGNGLLKQPQRMLISYFNSTNGIFVKPLCSFYLYLEIQCKKCIDLYNRQSVKCSTVSFSPLLILGEPVIKIHYLVL